LMIGQDGGLCQHFSQTRCPRFPITGRSPKRAKAASQLARQSTKRDKTMRIGINLLLAMILIVYVGPSQAQEGAVPRLYQDLYQSLDAKLTLAAKGFGQAETAYQPTFGVELTAANGNRGPQLLEPGVRQGVGLNLDAFQSMGVSGVTVSACFPMFLKDFPNSVDYLAFYKFVMAEARRRHLKVLLKIGEAFHDPVHGHLSVGEFYKNLTPERFMRQKREMIEIALRELQPDYLTVANEPDTSAMNTSLDFSPDPFIQYVQAFTKGLTRGKTKIGAGAGTWSPLTYWTRLAKETDVDYLDMHIYPVNFDFFTHRPLEVADLAAKNGKSLVIGEGWLHKSRDGELGQQGLSYVELFSRDVFSFWAPLDSKFIGDLVQYCRAHQVEYMSLFWVQYLFGYVDYTPALAKAAPGELQQLGVLSAIGNIVAKRPSSSGKAFQHYLSAP